ncbi:hypothetical protein QR680_004984 [Steinernema hermaphroditum]|uniref:Uncharacterized protein n=1 Tax=Steinernema hermaphroditum TaxID=289476 RepID=A0AA39HRI2_9BILA|nr:hypothetical protein QR680_004984 [Steinernema hermaphroditum]
MFDFFGFFRRSKNQHYANVYDGSPTKNDVTEPYKLAIDNRAQVAYLLACSPSQRIHRSATLVDIRMDRIDLALNERSQLTIPGLEDLGENIIHFYALGTNELVLVDYHKRRQLLKQRLIEVFDDGSSVLVRNSYDYALRIPHPYEHGIKTAVGKRFVVAMTREMLDGPILAVKLSKRPKKCPDSEREERRQFDRFLNDLSRFIGDQDPNLRISSFVSPFFTENDQKLNFFCMDRRSNEVDPTKIANVDIVSGEMSLKGAVRGHASGFPFDEYGMKPFVIDCVVAQNGFDHVGLMTKYRTPRSSFRWHVAAHLFRIQLLFLRAFFLCSSSRFFGFFGSFFLSVASHVSAMRDVVVQRPEASLGMLNTKKLEWRDMSACVEGCAFNDIHLELSQSSGHFVVILDEIGDDGQNLQKVRLVRSPFSCMSLGECAQFAIQKQREDFSVIERKRRDFQGHVIRARKRSVSLQRGRVHD